MCFGHGALGAVADNGVIVIIRGSGGGMADAVAISVYGVRHVDCPQSWLAVVEREPGAVERTPAEVDAQDGPRRAAVVVSGRRTDDEGHVWTVALDDAESQVHVNVLARRRYRLIGADCQHRNYYNRCLTSLVFDVRR